ncbi:SusC/RagA family TonB-linked outer membrane protein [Sphingobacterium bovistauri]|nr:SusC/RagA family TonB-linked outer membrane protein [Sphingobacterium bovistauri]
MKITTLLILAFSTLSYATGKAQKISLNLKNRSLEEAFKKIEQQTIYTFTYNKKLLKTANKVNVFLEGKSLEETLSTILKSQPLSYTIYDEHVVLSPKSNYEENGPKITNSKIEVQESLTGVIQDASGQLISGASILNITNNVRSISDVKGEFNIKGKIGDVLQVTYVGYNAEKITVSSASRVIVRLTLQDNTLEDVVVTALGIKRSEKALSYQIQQVSGEDLSASKGSNFVNSLVGKVAGAQINSSSSGPGGAVKVVLRGSKSIALDNNALYVIDGIPMNNFKVNPGEGSFASQPSSESIADINPDDIESISVMTGPTSAALYGYQGANGVILVTTKKGKADKTSLTYNHNTMFSTPLLLPQFQNKYGNAMNSNQSWGGVINSDYNPAKFFQTGYNMNNSLALSTGTDKSQNYFSMAYNNAEGIISNNTYNRYNFMYRNTTNFLDDKLTFDFSANYIIQKDLNMMSQGQYSNPLPAVYLFPRGEDFSAIRLFERYDEVTGRSTQFWPYGDQGLTMQNPYWTMNKMDRINNRKRYFLTASLKYNLTNDWNITGRVNADNMNRRFTDSRHAGTIGVLSGPLGRFNLQQNDQNQLYADIISNYKKNWSDFSLNLNVGGSIRHMNFESNSITGDLDKIGNYFSLENLDRSIGSYKVDQDGLRQQTQSVFASAEFGYKNALFLTLTERLDWDSALAMSTAMDKPMYDYPSIGLSAVINELTTLPQVFSYMKLRGSYARIGRPYAPYLTTEQYVYNDQTDTYSLPRIRPNYALKPEMTNTYEFGADMRFFNNALTFNVTYYSADTENQTHTIMESGTEYEAKLIQAGKVRNNGVEMLLGYDKSWGKFSWASNITYSINHNKVVQLYSDEIMKENPDINVFVNKAVLGSVGSPIVRLTEGGSLGDIYSTSDFKRDNNGHIFLNPSTLLPIIENLNSDEYRKLGSILPKTHVGWRNSFTYDNLRLNVALAGRFGGLVVSNTQAFLDRYGVSEYSANLREEGAFNILNNEIPIENYLNIIGEGTGKSDFYTYNADNVRLQEVSLEYKLDRKWFNNKAGVTVGISGNNLAFIYKKAPFDPEASPNASSTFYSGVDYFMQPTQKNFGFNVKVNF